MRAINKGLSDKLEQQVVTIMNEVIHITVVPPKAEMRTPAASFPSQLDVFTR